MNLLASFRKIRVSAVVAIVATAPVFAGPAELRVIVEALPAKLKSLYEKNEEGFGGSTADMVNAHGAVVDGILPDLLVLGTKDGTDEEKATLKDEVEGELTGVGAEVFYGNHARGWGGTITSIEMASARLCHVETRICYAVTQLYEKDKSFDLEGWHAKWEEAGGSVGMGSREEPAVVGISIVDGELRFSPGSSGGSCSEPAEGFAEKQIHFGAKEGQKLVIAATGVRLRLLRSVDDGALTGFTEWARCHELKLPASENGHYCIEFGIKEAGETKPSHLLIEIR